MSLATAGIHCTICQRLSGVMEDCSISGAGSSECSVAKGAVCPRHYACSARCGTQSPLTSIGDETAVVGQVLWWNARQWLVYECGHLEVDALVNQCSWWYVVGASGASDQTGAGFWTDCSRFISPSRCQRTASCNSPGGRKWTPGLMSYSHLQTTTGQPAAAGAVSSSRFDRLQRREPTATASCRWRRQGHGLCPALLRMTTEHARVRCWVWRAVDLNPVT